MCNKEKDEFNFKVLKIFSAFFSTLKSERPFHYQAETRRKSGLIMGGLFYLWGVMTFTIDRLNQI